MQKKIHFGLFSKSVTVFIFFLMSANLFAQAAEKAASSSTSSTASKAQTTKVGLRFDCLHDFNADKGSKQRCITLSGLRLDYSQKYSEETRADIRFDPFGTPAKSFANSPLRDDLPSVQDTKLLVVDDYAFIWSPRPNLDLALENYAGLATIPNMSGLASPFPLIDNGWDQTAVTVTYNLSTFEKMTVKFAAGNGEGENAENLDPQQFFSIDLGIYFITGFFANLGVSFDGNNVGSRAYEWNINNYQKDFNLSSEGKNFGNVGYSTQRAAFSLGLDGKLSVARGLKLVAGWQGSTMRDLNKKVFSTFSIEELQNNCKNVDGTPGNCKALRVDSVFVEDPTGETFNTVEHQVWVFNGSYLILDRYFFGFNYIVRHIDTGLSLFQTCSMWTDSVCVVVGESRRRILQSTVGVGGGVTLTEGLALSLEYDITTFDKLYKQAFYKSKDGRVSKEWDAINLRIAYNWD